MRSNPAAKVWLNLREDLLLETAFRRVEALSQDQRARIRELYDAASARASIASELLDARQHGAAFTLLREALALYLEAIAVGNDLPTIVSGGIGNLPRAIDELLEAGVLPDPPDELGEARAYLEQADILAFDRLSHDEALSRRAAIDEVVEYLRQLIEPRSPRELRLVRSLRLSALGLVAIVFLSLLAYPVFAPKNLAFGKPVTASSRHPHSKAPPNGLTDGSKKGPYGVHTNIEAEPWVMVDLEKPTKIGRIKVFNRTDGYFNEGLPFALELSDNGEDFTEITQRKAPFSRWRPWAHHAEGREARYIRIRKIGHGYVALSELEVYGAR